MVFTLAFALIGSIIRLAAFAEINGNYFSISFGHALIGIANILSLLDAYTHESNLDSNWTKLMIASGLPGGYLLS